MKQQDVKLIQDLEDQITSMLNVNEEIDTLFDAWDREKLSEDQIFNMLIGMKELHNQRHNKLWSTFEEVTKLWYQVIKNNNKLKQQKLNEDNND